ncbi:MAG: sulfotransferase [Oceanospirillaceae bacterium]|nr:sulfotransferase [Oceanospirillaceae bacterium]
MPDVFILGFTKCATTSLYDQLCTHPGIIANRVKEPHFHFAQLRGTAFNGPADDDTVAQMFISNRCDYIKLYNREDGITIDASAMSIENLDIVSMIHDEHPEARYILMLRNPLDRAFSAFSHMVRDARESKSFRQALEEELQGEREGHLPIWRYLDSSRYVERVQGARRLLGDRLMVIRYDDYIQNNATTMDTVARFIGIDPIEWQLEHSNKSGNPRSKSLQKALMRKSIVKSTFVALFPRSFVTAAKRFISDLNVGEKSRLCTDDRDFFHHCIRDERVKIDSSAPDAPLLQELYSS